MAMAAPARPAPPVSTAIDFESKEMTDDLVQEILLRFPCSASLACAAFHSMHLRRIVSDGYFLHLFRKRHPSSPLLGIFASSDRGRFPLFKNVTSDTILSGVICRADTGLAYLDKNKDWHLADCHNGRLLLCSDDSSFCIYEPLSQRRVDCGNRPYDDEGDYINSCLFGVGGISPARHMVSVQQCGQSTEALESFRVVCLQRRRRSKSEVRVVEYESGTLEWRAHPWNKFPSLEFIGDAMHAAGHIFWRCSWAFLLVLDTNNMKFSMEPYPWPLGLNFAIGELEDGKGCAVCLQGLNTPDFDADGSIQQRHLKVRLQVWTIEKKKREEEEKEEVEEEEDERCIFDWKMKEEVFVSKILDKDIRVSEVTKVVNGLVVICHRYNQDHYVINLQSKTLVAIFNNGGRAISYLYQLPWPPSVLAGATTMASIPKKHLVGDEVSKQYPSNNKDGPATTEERYPLMTLSFNDIMSSVDQINLGENSPEATASSALVANTSKMLEPHESLQDGDLLNMTGLFYDIMPRMDQINLGENSREATVSSALVNNTGEMMEQHKILQEAYPINMAGATTMASIHKKHIAGDEVTKQYPSNNKDGPTTTDDRHIDSDEVSKECPSNTDGLATADERHIAGDEVSKQCSNNKKEGPATTEDRYIAGDEESKQCPRNNKDGSTITEERAKETTSKDICQFKMQKKTNVTWSYDSTKYCSATAGKCPCGLEVTVSLSDTEETFDDKLASGVEDKELGLAPTRPKRKAKASLWLADYVSRGKGVREGNDSQKGGRTGSASLLQGNVSTRRCGIDGELDDYIDGSLVYDPLMKRGCINEEGRFVWSDSNGKAEASTETEVEAFLADEQVLPFQQRIESAAVEDVDGRDQLGFQLPEDILPSYDVARPTEVLATNVPERMSKKQKAARRPVQATKQSTRINRSRSIMEKAKEMMKK